MKSLLLILLLLFFIPLTGEAEESLWNGFRRLDFTFRDRPAILVFPEEAATDPQGKHPWVWRARFFGHEPQVDLALLEGGFHLVYADVADLFGSPSAVEHWNAFYDRATVEHGLSPKVALEGMSRGGLIIYSWAAENPEKVACIYADAPVLDIRSWPAGKGSSQGSPQAWETCLRVWGLTEKTLPDFRGNPLDRLEPLAEQGIPLLHVVGDADEVVPVAENTAILEERYRALGGDIHVIHKPGVGHHPHCLEDPAPIVEFILRHTGMAAR